MRIFAPRERGESVGSNNAPADNKLKAQADLKIILLPKRGVFAFFQVLDILECAPPGHWLRRHLRLATLKAWGETQLRLDFVRNHYFKILKINFNTSRLLFRRKYGRRAIPAGKNKTTCSKTVNGSQRQPKKYSECCRFRILPDFPVRCRV